MHEHETMETSVVMMEERSDAAHEETAEAVKTIETVGTAEAAESPTDGVLATLAAEARALRAVYPDFDLDAEMAHPVLGGLLRGEGKPTLRQLYEAVHWEDIAAERVKSAVAAAVEAAVAEAVKASEERLLSHIRARGQRPMENGLRAVEGIRMHPAVGRLTRRERAMLAKRAENGETIQF